MVVFRIVILLALVPCCTVDSNSGSPDAAVDAGGAVVDASTPPELPPDAFVNPAGNEEICTLSESNASVSGTTPSGEIDHQYAWFVYDYECSSAYIAFDDQQLVEVSPQGRFLNDSFLRIDIEGPNELGDQPASFFLGGNKDFAAPFRVQGIVNVTESSFDSIKGSFHLETEGWNLIGNFQIESECLIPVGLCI